MRLILFEPVVAARSCDDCKKWLYDDAWKGDKFVFSTEICTRGKGSKNERKLERIEYSDTTTVATPCRYCPKKSPEHAKTLELSAQNLQAIEFYFQVKACRGANLTKRMKMDETLLSNLSIIDGIYRQHEQLTAQSATLSAMSAMVSSITPR